MTCQAAPLSVFENLSFALDFQRDAPDAFTKWHAIKGPTLSARIPGHRIISSIAAPVLRHVLIHGMKNFGKGRYADDLAPLWGKSTVQLADGPDWARQRRVCGGVFSASHSGLYIAAIERRSEAMLESLDNAARSGQPVPIYYAFRDACYRALSDVWFPGLSDAEVDRLAELIREGTDIASKRMLSLVKAPISWSTPANRRYLGIAAQAHSIVDRAITRACSHQSGGILNAVAHSIGGDPSKSLSPIEARNNVFMFLLACYEWPTLGWVLFELATRAQVRHKAIAEAVATESDAAVSTAELPYLQACIKETFRLRPPAPLIGRSILADTEVEGLRLRPGQSLVIPVKAVHRDPARWSDPDGFHPERFSEPCAEFDFLAFGTGPRGCIGERMSLQVMQVVLARALRHFDFESMPAASPRMHDKLKSYPKGGVPAVVRYH